MDRNPYSSPATPLAVPASPPVGRPASRIVFGRTLSIAYGWYAIVAAVFGLIVNWISLVQPMMANVNQADGPAAAAAIGGAVGGLLGGCFGMIFPIILLVFMARPALRDALAGGIS